MGSRLSRVCLYVRLLRKYLFKVARSMISVKFTKQMYLYVGAYLPTREELLTHPYDDFLLASAYRLARNQERPQDFG